MCVWGGDSLLSVLRERTVIQVTLLKQPSHLPRRYSEPLLDILLAGGMLAPGGKLESTTRAEVCVLTCEPMVEALRGHMQVLQGVGIVL